MDERSGTFIPENATIGELLKCMPNRDATGALERLRPSQQKPGPGNARAMPTLGVGEIVAIKGVDFKVTRIKPYSGVLRLVMVKKP